MGATVALVVAPVPLEATEATVARVARAAREEVVVVSSSKNVPPCVPSNPTSVILHRTVKATTVVRNINRPSHTLRPCPPTNHPVILLRTVKATTVVINHNHNHNSVVTKNVSSPAVVTTVARVAKVAKVDTTVEVASDTVVTVAT